MDYKCKDKAMREKVMRGSKTIFQRSIRYLSQLLLIVYQWRKTYMRPSNQIVQFLLEVQKQNLKY